MWLLSEPFPNQGLGGRCQNAVPPGLKRFPAWKNPDPVTIQPSSASDSRGHGGGLEWPFRLAQRARRNIVFVIRSSGEAAAMYRTRRFYRKTGAPIVSNHRAQRRTADLERIKNALEEAARVAASFTPEQLDTKQKGGRGPVTAADHAVNELLLGTLPGPDEGWLSEETADELSRLDRHRVWVVDPIDGTLEFVEGIPEWCVSIGLVEDGKAVAGGICNPATGELFLGSLETGISLNGEALPVPVPRLGGERLVLASRSEVKRGEWADYENRGFTIRPMGSVAYKLARVAAGLADATWTLVPKHEWDVAAGAALVKAGGGSVRTLDGSEPVFNCRKPKLSGLLAFGPGQAYLFEKSEAPGPSGQRR